MLIGAKRGLLLPKKTTPFGIFYIGTGTNTTSGSSFTFAAQNLGAPDPTRIIVVAPLVGGTAPLTINSVTIGGINATQAPGAAQSQSGGVGSDIWYLADGGSLGSSASVVVTMSASQVRAALVVYRVVGTGVAFSSASGSVTSGNVLTLSATNSISAKGGAILAIDVHSNVTVTNGGNITIDSSGVAYGLQEGAAGSNITSVGSTTFTFNWGSAAGAAMSVASFG